MSEEQRVPVKVSELAAQLVELKPMRRGSLSERYVKCGKPECGCREEKDARHGPYFSLTRGIKGRTESRWIAAEQAEMIGQQIDAAAKFRERLEAYWNACEEWADAEASGAGSQQIAEKRGSRKLFKKKRSRKLKPF